MAITNIRLLPPLAIARLGSSPEPLENYDLEIGEGVSPREIVPAATLRVDPEGNLSVENSAGPVSFRDSQGRIKPVAPFFELWAQTSGSEEWVPVTKDFLLRHGLSERAVTWSATMANIKVFRRTGDPNDRMEAQTGDFHDHVPHPLNGFCANFLDGAYVPLGSVQHVKPDEAFAGLRIRFTPAQGKVYGSKTDHVDPNVVGVVYDPAKGKWPGYSEPDNPANNYAGRRLTNPAEIFAGYDENGNHISYGYIDDECDGLIECRLRTGGEDLTTFARVAAGPPTFAPDSMPVRTVADELEQALNGPDVAADPEAIEEVKDIVRRALETVRLMNTGHLNEGGSTRGVGMARMDILDYARKSEPIFDPLVADSLAIRARHERVLLALESGSLAWFARILRDYDKVGDLTDEGRRRMPGMMRNADGRHLALTRRQVSKVKSVAEYIVQFGARPAEVTPARKVGVTPLNLTAQLEYRAQGNPPNSLPDTAISNAYPGLEMDARNVWKRILVGLTLHESLNFVLDAETEELKPLKGMFLMTVADIPVTAPVTGPDSNGVVGPLKDTSFGSDRMSLEWSNALADVVRSFQGQSVRCVFQSIDGKECIEHWLVVRHFFEPDSALIAREIAEPGALTQSLCAPWQNDYRECSCFYWASNRPDFVNVEPGASGSAVGQNWMQKDRTANTPKVYINDDWQDDRLLSHTDLVRNWEKALRFVIANQDEPPIAS